jgi:hypothetical protein
MELRGASVEFRRAKSEFRTALTKLPHAFQFARK